MKDTVTSFNFARSGLYTALLSAGLLCSATAQAQTVLEETVVTAQKRTQNINDVGITINAFTGEQLQEFGVATPEDIAQFTPGLTVNETAATGVPLYTIRGVGFQDYSTAATSTVGLYFDEVAMPYSVMTRGLLFDQERVEVLKGPQGDLFGANTTAGSINFISNKPTQEFEAGIRATYGNYESYDLEAFVSGGSELVQGRLA
ncbi:MAG: TonB-dependent receptor plug domain-containing protein, partial [Pseudomonadota bacterium]